MLSPITGSLCRNMKRSLNEVKSSSSASTKRSTTSEESNNRERSSERTQREEADQYGSDGEGEWTVFKAIFKKYKRRAPPPDLQDVIDPRLENPDSGLDFRSLEDSSYPEKQALFERLGMKPISEWRVASFPDRKGLFLLPGLLKAGSDVEWMKRVVGYTEPPNRTNMDAHGTAPQSNVLRTAGKRLRWTTLGVEYDWNTKEYPATGREIPQELVLFGKVISEALGLGTMTPDATIVNYYPPKSALSPHVDRSERSNAPLISLSLGQSAIYLSGGMSLDDPVIPIWLHSGDVLVMFGEQRLVYHAIPSVWPTRKFVVDEDPFIANYLNEHRINMTIRQVNP